MKKFKISVLLIIGLILILLATTVISQAVSEIKTTVENAICAILRIFQALAAGVAALMIILQGVKWMTSEDPAGRKAAKDMITHVFVAMIIIIIAVQFVNYLVTGTGIAEFTSCPGITGPIGPPPTIPVGTACTSSSQCGSDKYCRNDGTCQPKRNNLEECRGTYLAIDNPDNACPNNNYCDTLPTPLCKEYPNRKPYAKITETSLTRLECQGFTLNGDKSNDPDGDSITDYHWYQVDCNTGTVLSDIGSTGGQSYLEHDFTTSSTYCIGLIVTDEHGLQSDMSPKPYATIYVHDNNAPTVTIESSKDPNNMVILNEEFNLTANVAEIGGLKDDWTYLWVVGNSADCQVTLTPNNVNKTNVKITNDDNGDWQCKINVTVTNSCGLRTMVTETIDIVTNQRPYSNPNIIPSSVAQRSSFTIDGSGSTSGGNCVGTSNEAGDSITKYKWNWSRTSPATPEVKGTEDISTKTMTLEKTGYYSFQLNVTDSHGQSCISPPVTLTVCENLPSTNDAPKADASLTLTDTRNTFKAGQQLILNASKSYDPDDWSDSNNPEGAVDCGMGTSQGKSITKYIWRATPPDAEICSTTLPTCTYTFDNFGTYTIKLTVEDGPLATYGKSGSATITFTINP